MVHWTCSGVKSDVSSSLTGQVLHRHVNLLETLDLGLHSSSLFDVVVVLRTLFAPWAC